MGIAAFSGIGIHVDLRLAKLFDRCDDTATPSSDDSVENAFVTRGAESGLLSVDDLPRLVDALDVDDSLIVVVDRRRLKRFNCVILAKELSLLI